MAVELRALNPSFAAEVDGIDLSQPMDAGSVRTIWDAIDRYAVLVFRDQRLTDTQLRDFDDQTKGVACTKRSRDGNGYARRTRQHG